MTISVLIGAWIAVFLTLSIFSYLYKDNPFYKIAEHVFVGVSAAYVAAISFWTQIYPNLLGRLFPKDGPLSFTGLEFDFNHSFNVLYVFPLLLGVMMVLSVFQKFNWMARWGIAYTVGMAAGLRAYGVLNSNVIGQVKNTIIPVVGTDLPFFSLTGDSYFNNLIILIGTVTGLLYFYFSREQTGHFSKVTKVGIYFLMISFGASFGFAVMGRISLLIGRFLDLIKYSGSEFHHASVWVLLAMVILLGYSAYQEKESSN